MPSRSLRLALAASGGIMSWNRRGVGDSHAEVPFVQGERLEDEAHREFHCLQPREQGLGPWTGGRTASASRQVEEIADSDRSEAR